jgi:hypothetical protein
MIVKFPNTKFYENPFSGSRLYAGTQTDTAKVKGPFLQLFGANAPKTGKNNKATKDILINHIINSKFRLKVKLLPYK